jgi:dTDP-4-dehydrorhamnose reductase
VGGLTLGVTPDRPAIWAGPECSYLTFGDWTCDQLALTGHDGRIDDIDRLAALGATAVRYPVIWGRDRGTRAPTDWAWAECRLDRLDRLDISPIVGLLHHGFGPDATDPLDPRWPKALAGYASEVARRFPTASAFLPINEPLTTARFGGLYGWWPPYGQDDSTFISLLLAQAQGFVAASRAIRAVRPDAMIILNEDVGQTWGTRACRSAVGHANERRWLSFDLVTGRVDRSHPLWSYVATTSAHRRILDRLARDPDPPDVLGIDHYVTSDRYLDHHVDQYPIELHGGDGSITYADVELARVAGHEVGGFRGAIAEVWARYQLPMALTEVQLAGASEDQLAWWAQAWAAAVSATREGVPVLAVTAWSAFGAFDWSSVLRRRDGTYEAGCYDVTSDIPKPTGLPAVLAATARGSDPDQAAGWWQRDDRFLYGSSLAPT